MFSSLFVLFLFVFVFAWLFVHSVLCWPVFVSVSQSVCFLVLLVVLPVGLDARLFCFGIYQIIRLID